MFDSVSIWLPSTVGGDRLRERVPPGSAIVGPWQPLVGKTRLYVEGNRYNFPDMTRFVQRVHHAWDRWHTQAPTVASVFVSLYEVQEVALYDPNRRVVRVNELDLPKLVAWLGYEPGQFPNSRVRELVW